MNSLKYCPLCNCETISHRESDGCYIIECSCQELVRTDKKYLITTEVYEDFFDPGNSQAKFGTSYNNRELNSNELMLLRYYHSKAQQSNKDARRIDTDFIDIIQKQNFPSIVEQLDNLILWCGEYGDKYPPYSEDFLTHGHIIGSKNQDFFNAVIEKAKNFEYLNSTSPLRLAFNGYIKYEELSNGNPKGLGAFMAMKFGDPDLNKAFQDCFIPAIQATGFNLKKLDDNPQTGLIDNRLRQEIRLARFVMADLTHGNNGAYWEAGYAEGLGKPVIYTCEKSTFNSGNKPHFDTNHHQTIIWDKENLKEAEDKLKATIRCTIPEAKQND